MKFLSDKMRDKLRNGTKPPKPKPKIQEEWYFDADGNQVFVGEEE